VTLDEALDAVWQRLKTPQDLDKAVTFCSTMSRLMCAGPLGKSVDEPYHGMSEAELTKHIILSRARGSTRFEVPDGEREVARRAGGTWLAFRNWPRGL
jgi:hypothetical protein